jgi:hypothetical protein
MDTKIKARLDSIEKAMKIADICEFCLKITHEEFLNVEFRHGLKDIIQKNNVRLKLYDASECKAYFRKEEI